LFLQWATSKPVAEASFKNGAAAARASSWRSEAAATQLGSENAERMQKVLQNVDSTNLSNAWKHAKWSEVADPFARALNATVVGGSAEKELGKAQAAALKILGMD
jgi:hypothetical protein